VVSAALIIVHDVHHHGHSKEVFLFRRALEESCVFGWPNTLSCDFGFAHPIIRNVTSGQTRSSWNIHPQQEDPVNQQQSARAHSGGVATIHSPRPVVQSSQKGTHHTNEFLSYLLCWSGGKKGSKPRGEWTGQSEAQERVRCSNPTHSTPHMF
jgi:hypothetical protein